MKEYSHLVQLFIDLLVVLVIFTELGDQGPVSQCKQLRILQTKTPQKSHEKFVTGNISLIRVADYHVILDQKNKTTNEAFISPKQK